MKPTTFIFDMDGVMIDSEPFWQQAQINVLGNLGVPITAKDCETYTMGKRIDHVAETWYNLYDLSSSPIVLADQILDQVVFQILKNGNAIRGLTELLSYLKKEKYKIGLATSSSWKVIDAVLQRLNVASYFDQICSADDEVYGKPNPAVYLQAMKQLNSQPEECIILEDSVTGMIAAKASMAYTIVLTNNSKAPKFAIADARCASLIGVIDQLQKL
ncbi:hexitol phosphatase HxpB [Wenyingzhuangia aestuarii]|uniref:hexitol phosphatase HxpB n=1 Tax=Wenyingzhuangia aestuarii TaxID=1647582 RepID=UPI00143B6931|nr:hexitol phosphatase HxpB [Wenyingzhuangia aestuarii]NJB83747.1 HAD superfamily hydrolase (TIGR01509 family) [Wenyingzhuangia aestuarii]